jgi:hypothetical protein
VATSAQATKLWRVGSGEFSDLSLFGTVPVRREIPAKTTLPGGSVVIAKPTKSI